MEAVKELEKNNSLPEHSNILRINWDSMEKKKDRKHIIKTKSNNSPSFIYQNIRKEEQKKQTLRLLSLDGGGQRGLIEITTLSVLEAILNHPMNSHIKQEILHQRPPLQKDKRVSDYVYIHDVFDAGSGTSTGGILTAGLFSHYAYKTIELARLYYRFGTLIFDENVKKVDGGWLSSKYDVCGLKKLLVSHFRSDDLRDIYKPIFIVATDVNKKTAVVFSPLSSKEDHNKISIEGACTASASAPTYFNQYQHVNTILEDGGVIANKPTGLALSMLKKSLGEDAHHYHIYSLGTGSAPGPILAEASGTSIPQIAQFINRLMDGATNKDLKLCINQLKTDGNGLSYMAHLNPNLSADLAEMDDTSEKTLERLIDLGFSNTKENIFAQMVKTLGFQMPSADEMQKIRDNIRSELDTLFDVTENDELKLTKKMTILDASSYGKLGKRQQEWIKRKFFEFDLNFLNRILGQFQIKASDHIFNQFLNSFVEDFQQNTTWTMWFNELRKWAFGTNINWKDFLPKALEFHNKVCNEGVQIKQIKDLLNPAETIADNLINKFIEICDFHDIKNHNVPGINYLSMVFWQDTFRFVRDDLKSENLKSLQNALAQKVGERIENNGQQQSIVDAPEIIHPQGLFTSITNKVSFYFRPKIANSRAYVLYQGLEHYIEKNFPNQANNKK